jgi:hypothetical protein
MTILYYYVSARRCWVLGAGCWVLGARCWVLGAGCWVLGAGCWVLGAGCWVLGGGCWVLGAGCEVGGAGLGGECQELRNASRSAWRRERVQSKVPQKRKNGRRVAGHNSPTLE